jgi:predicted PurR-regulated permease PerM
MAFVPRDRLSSWLPHVLLLVLLVGALAWLAVLVWPVSSSLAMGGSLALLTHPVLYGPLDRWIARTLPRWPVRQRRYVTSLLSTLAVLGVVLGVVVVLLWALLGSLVATRQALVALVFQEKHQTDHLVAELTARASKLLVLYPNLGLSVNDLKDAIASVIQHDRPGPEFVRFLFTGTGGLVVHLVLTLTTLFYLYSQGAILLRMLLLYLPLTRAQQAALRRRFVRTVQHMIFDTVGRALMNGIAMGFLAWVIGGFNPVLVAAVGMFVGLMPIVGHTFVWLPLAGVLVSQGRWLDAGCLAAAAVSAAWLIEQAAWRMAMALGTAEIWLSFLLFLSVVGGVLGQGPAGLLLGPAAVITVVILVQFVASLYGHRDRVRAGTERLRRPPSDELPALDAGAGKDPGPGAQSG